MWLSLLLSLFLVVSPYIVKYINNPSTPATAEEIIYLNVEGMKCLGCANAIHNVLNSVDGVVQNQVLLEEKQAIVYTKSSAHVDEDKLKEVIDDLGFTVEVQKRIHRE